MYLIPLNEHCLSAFSGQRRQQRAEDDAEDRDDGEGAVEGGVLHGVGWTVIMTAVFSGAPCASRRVRVTV